ncbi:LPXTG cell wall anchor domain-containing protein [Rhizophagus clarus]|uniref:LPXTG cell wall anchor domain-containing protein n=1 Tax=Rhizophagus clarus TaxID=94130 RepID=A0A8H3QVS6_9GLOM|nr:LPXTG cell wall anchor domain-containing protein [Rhizophagus clarus]
MVKRQHQRTSSLCCASIASTSAQIRKPAVTTRSRRNQNAEFEQQKLFAFDTKRKRRSNIETDTLERDDEIDRRLSPSYSNSNIVDSIKLENNESVSSPSKRAKLSTMGEYNNNQFDIDNDVQSNVEIMGVKLENISTQNGVRRNSILRNGIESKDIVQPGINNGIDNIDEIIDKNNEQDDCKITEDIICNNIEMIIDNFKDAIEIRGTQAAIGNFVVEYNDYQKFLALMNKLVDIFEMYDSDRILQSAKKIGCKRNNGQILNPNLFRTKISKRAYKCLNEFQDDFTCTCYDAIDANPEKYNAGMNFLKFGDRLFEQAYRELPSGIRQLCDHNDNFDATKGTSTKRYRKVALIQPTLDGHVFSSGAIRKPQGNNSFRLVGDLQEIAVVPSQSMNEEEIPTLGSILPKNMNHEFELPMPGQHKVPGVKFHKYKAYASFAPIYDSSTAMLSYEDTILTCTHKEHLRTTKNIDELDNSDDSDLSEEEESFDESMVVSEPEETSQPENFEIASSKQDNSDEETSQMEGLEITLPEPNKQDNSDEEMSHMEDLEITLPEPNKQNNSNEEMNNMEGLEITLPESNKQNNSNEEMSHIEGHEITLPNKQNNSNEEISQIGSLETIFPNKQNNSSEEMSQMENLETTLPTGQTNSSEEMSQVENLGTTIPNKQDNSSEEMNQMENLETTLPNKQSNSNEETRQIESLEIVLPNNQNNSDEEVSKMDSFRITSNNINISGEKIGQMESFEIVSNKQNDSVDDIFIVNNTTENEKLFEDINVELLYKCINNGKTSIDKILDENVEIFKKVLLMQEKRLTKRNSNIISTKERNLAIKLRDKLASIISEVTPSDIVSFDSIEYAMDNLPIKEKFFKVPSLEQLKSEDSLPQAPQSVPQTISQQSLHHSTSSASHPLPISSSMTYPRTQIPMRMSYGTSQGMPASYQTTYQRTTSHVPPYYHPSQRYPPTYGYPYYPQYGGYPMSHSAWQQRSSYFQ